MKILRLLHPEHGLCAQQVIRPNFTQERIKKDWNKKYGQMIKNCTYELYDDKPKYEMVIKNTQTGEIYENKDEAILATGLNINTINKILGKTKGYPSPFYLTYIKKEAI